MMNPVRAICLSLLAATSVASAAEAPFYFISIADKDNAVLFTDAKALPKGDLSYALLNRAGKGCCFKAGARPGARKQGGRGDGDGQAGELISDEDKATFRHVGYLNDPTKPALDLAYGFEGMQSVTQKKRDTYQITLQAGSDPVFVRTCYTGEGLRLRLFHRLTDRKPYASYYYYLGYEVERTCR